MGVGFPFLTAGVGFLAGVLVALLAALFARQSARPAWLRERRIGTYAAFLSGASRLCAELGQLQERGTVAAGAGLVAAQVPEATRALYAETVTAYHTLNLLGSATVIPAAGDLFLLVERLASGTQLDPALLRGTERRFYAAAKAELRLPAVAFDRLPRVHIYEP